MVIQKNAEDSSAAKDRRGHDQSLEIPDFLRVKRARKKSLEKVMAVQKAIVQGKNDETKKLDTAIAENMETSRKVEAEIKELEETCLTRPVRFPQETLRFDFLKAFKILFYFNLGPKNNKNYF